MHAEEVTTQAPQIIMHFEGDTQPLSFTIVQFMTEFLLGEA
jgi:hypothetical protein